MQDAAKVWLSVQQGGGKQKESTGVKNKHLLHSGTGCGKCRTEQIPGASRHRSRVGGVVGYNDDDTGLYNVTEPDTGYGRSCLGKLE